MSKNKTLKRDVFSEPIRFCFYCGELSTHKIVDGTCITYVCKECIKDLKPGCNVCKM